MKEFVLKLYVTDTVGGAWQVPEARFPTAGTPKFALHRAGLGTENSLSVGGGVPGGNRRPLRQGETACRHALFTAG